MKARILIFLFLLSFLKLSAQETSELQTPSQELLSAPRLLEPETGSQLDAANFPRFISPEDFAATTGNLLFHFTSARFALAPSGPDSVDFILEGYVSNYSDKAIELFDGDFSLNMNGTELLPNIDIMNALKREYGTSRDFPGRNVPFVSRLNVNVHQVRFIFLAWRIPATTKEAGLRLSYSGGNATNLHILLLPEDNDGTSAVNVFKLSVDNVAQYQMLDPIEGEPFENGEASDIVPPVDYDNCGRDPATFNYRSFTSSGLQRLTEFELSINPQESRSEFTTILGLVVMASHVERSLFELNYRRLESSYDMVQSDIEITTTVRAFTALHYAVREQPMRRIDTYRMQHGTQVLEFPYIIDYSTVQVDSYQEDITTEYCESREG